MVRRDRSSLLLLPLLFLPPHPSCRVSRTATDTQGLSEKIVDPSEHLWAAIGPLVVNTESVESDGSPGLYPCRELLQVRGKCGRCCSKGLRPGGGTEAAGNRPSCRAVAVLGVVIVVVVYADK